VVRFEDFNEKIFWLMAIPYNPESAESIIAAAFSSFYFPDRKPVKSNHPVRLNDLWNVYVKFFKLNNTMVPFSLDKKHELFYLVSEGFPDYRKDIRIQVQTEIVGKYAEIESSHVLFRELKNIFSVDVNELAKSGEKRLTKKAPLNHLQVYRNEKEDWEGNIEDLLEVIKSKNAAITTLTYKNKTLIEEINSKNSSLKRVESYSKKLKKLVSRKDSEMDTIDEIVTNQSNEIIMLKLRLKQKEIEVLNAQ